MNPMVQALQVTRRFGNVTAVRDLTFDVAEGEIFGVVGPDGAGKTTTLRMLTTILDPTSGEARVDGLDTVRDAEAIKERIGYMSQRFGLYGDLTVLENLKFYADVFCVPRRGLGESIETLLAFSSLGPFRHRRAAHLSGGMKQKLALACTLIHTPRVLFLDEPTNGVDPVSRREFWRILHQLLRRRVTIVVSTSYLDEAERCNRVALLHNGRLLACGTPAEVKRGMRQQVLSVSVDEPRAAMRVLRRALVEGTVDLFGDRVHVMTKTPDAARAAVTAILQREGFGTASVREVEPGLEDVFVATLTDHGREGG